MLIQFITNELVFNDIHPDPAEEQNLPCNLLPKLLVNTYLHIQNSYIIGREIVIKTLL